MSAVSPAAPTTVVAVGDLKPQTLNELLDITKDQLHRVDIARMNLLAASGMPTTRGLDVEHALAKLDEWAVVVARETDRHLYRVADPRYADHYGHSEAQLRAEFLAQVLQVNLGVKYDLSAVDDFSFADPSVAFIHGMIPGPGQTTADTPGGTCASMPVLYVAVGRRLGYPLKLVTTDSHIFARWDGADHPNPAWRETFNCETTNGFSKFSDNHYKQWPREITDFEVRANGHLVSLSPAEEMAQFMAARGHHGTDLGQLGFAARCYENAYRYDARRPCYVSWFMGVAMASDYHAETPALREMLYQKRWRGRLAKEGDAAYLPPPMTVAVSPSPAPVNLNESPRPTSPSPHVWPLQPSMAAPSFHDRSFTPD